MKEKKEVRISCLLFFLCLSISGMTRVTDSVTYSKNIPTLYIETADGTLNYVHQEKGNKILATIATINTNGEIVYSGRCELSGRGNSTWKWPKRPYNLKFEQSTDVICANDSANEWCLLANYMDSSQIRNALCYYMAREMGVPYTSDIYFVSLYINGNYFGLYNLATKQKYKVDIGNKVTAVFEKVIQNIYLKNIIDGVSNHNFFFRRRYGSTDEILKAINTFETILYNDSTIYEDLLKYADIESIARKNLVDLITGDADVAISQYYMLDDFHRISAINAWDYDISYGIQPLHFDFAYNEIMSDHPWYNALFRYKEYREELLNLMQQNESLLNEKCTSFEDSLYRVLQNDLLNNATKWGIANLNREQIDSFRVKRFTFLKEYIEAPDKFHHLRFIDSGGKDFTICCSLNDTVTLSMLPEGMLPIPIDDFEGYFTTEGISIADIGVISQDMEFYKKSNGTSGDPFYNATLEYFLPLAVILFFLFLLWLIVEGVIIPVKRIRDER